MIALSPYQPAWPSEFSGLAGRLRRHLGPLALRIDHIGSTSVPGLAAKDIIDIQVTVEALARAWCFSTTARASSAEEANSS